MTTPAARPEKVRFLSLSLDREAIAILHAEAPTSKAHGRFLSRLLYEHKARKDAQAEVLALYGLTRTTEQGDVSQGRGRRKVGSTTLGEGLNNECPGVSSGGRGHQGIVSHTTLAV
jgi:hypothetical protein